MKRNALHTLVLFAFALLQCVAPLVHAHVDGRAGASIYAHSIPQHLSGRSISQCHVESHESQAIAISSEYQRDNSLVVIADLATSTHPPACSATYRTVVAFNTSYALSDIYLTPQPHAPPRLN